MVPLYFASVSVKYRPIFKILSPTDLALNCEQRDNKVSHHIPSNASILWFVKYFKY